MKKNEALFRPIQIGSMKLPNRIFMAPLTRSRSVAPEHTQTPLHTQYYRQRASAGLIISEATQISPEGQGYAWTPGIFSEKQIQSWQPVIDGVHQLNGHMFCQLWHVGAISHNVFQPQKKAPVSSSAWVPQGKAFVGNYHPDGPLVPFPQSHALTKNEIEKIISDYKHAALSAQKAGFDGIELHAANGYLIDQFLRDSVNRREDEYGGSVENRIRFLLEVVEALTSVLPAEKIGVRLTPIGGPGGSSESHPETLYPAAAKALAQRGLAYLHVVRPNSHAANVGEAERSNLIVGKMRKAFDGPFVANGEFTPEEAETWIADGRADAIAFGRLFIANPDLPRRISQDGPYNEADRATFYGGDSHGYTDYPSLS